MLLILKKVFDCREKANDNFSEFRTQLKNGADVEEEKKKGRKWLLTK